MIEATVSKWEFVTDEGGPFYTERLKIPGGWLYRSMAIYDQGEGGNALALVFVPETSDTLATRSKSRSAQMFDITN